MEKGILKTIKGDVTEPQFSHSNEIAIIPHVCNNIGAWGAGFVLALNKKWSGPEYFYRKMEKESPNGLKNRLGEIQWVDIDKDKGNIIVINMIAQDGIISKDRPFARPLKYWALMKCMEQVRWHIGTKITSYVTLPEHMSKKAVIHCPKFGSDLAGGKWNFILELIEEQWLDDGIDVVVYEFD
jgi:hypothetical protein